MIENRDKYIVKQIQNRNEYGIRILLEDYGNVIKSVIWYYLRMMPIEDREECLNDTILDIWEKIDSYDNKRGLLKNWIVGVAKYNSLDCLRKRIKKYENVNIDDYIDILRVENEISIIKKELDDQLQKLMEILNDSEKQLIMLYFIDGISVKDISKMLGIKENTIYRKIERSIRKMKKRAGVIDEVCNLQYDK